MIEDKGLLLDTHVWIWLNNAEPELKPKVIALIDAAAQGGGVFISAITVWEVATLVSKKRLILQISLVDWIETALSQPGIELLPLSPRISIESVSLPGIFHGDPADRIITATARVHQLTLLTRDNLILQYAKKGFLSVLKG
ncbi:MAG: type II toxin-antitoxin system VapC family toxin [Gammaproteobacteria bacterium]|nr:type II toxin-antitoxin system VapC family toxin [Gammaproteobacteria bacterium]